MTAAHKIWHYTNDKTLLRECGKWKVIVKAPRLCEVYNGERLIGYAKNVTCAKHKVYKIINKDQLKQREWKNYGTDL